MGKDILRVNQFDGTSLWIDTSWYDLDVLSSINLEDRPRNRYYLNGNEELPYCMKIKWIEQKKKKIIEERRITQRKMFNYGIPFKSYKQKQFYNTFFASPFFIFWLFFGIFFMLLSSKGVVVLITLSLVSCYVEWRKKMNNHYEKMIKEDMILNYTWKKDIDRSKI